MFQLICKRVRRRSVGHRHPPSVPLVPGIARSAACCRDQHQMHKMHQMWGLRVSGFQGCSTFALIVFSWSCAVLCCAALCCAVLCRLCLHIHVGVGVGSTFVMKCRYTVGQSTLLIYLFNSVSFFILYPSYPPLPPSPPSRWQG